MKLTLQSVNTVPGPGTTTKASERTCSNATCCGIAAQRCLHKFPDLVRFWVTFLALLSFVKPTLQSVNTVLGPGTKTKASERTCSNTTHCGTATAGQGNKHGLLQEGSRSATLAVLPGHHDCCNQVAHR